MMSEAVSAILGSLMGRSGTSGAITRRTLTRFRRCLAVTMGRGNAAVHPTRRSVWVTQRGNYVWIVP